MEITPNQFGSLQINDELVEKNEECRHLSIYVQGINSDIKQMRIECIPLFSPKRSLMPETTEVVNMSSSQMNEDDASKIYPWNDRRKERKILGIVFSIILGCYLFYCVCYVLTVFRICPQYKVRDEHETNIAEQMDELQFQPTTNHDDVDDILNGLNAELRADSPEITLSYDEIMQRMEEHEPYINIMNEMVASKSISVIST